MAELMPFNPENDLLPVEYKRLVEMAKNEISSQKFMENDELRISLEEELWRYFLKHGLTDENINQNHTTDVYRRWYLQLCENVKKKNPDFQIKTINQLREVYQNSHLSSKTKESSWEQGIQEDTTEPITKIEIKSKEWTYAIWQRIWKEIIEKFNIPKEQIDNLKEDINNFLKSFLKKYKFFAAGDEIKIYDNKLVLKRDDKNKRDLDEVYYEYKLSQKLNSKAGTLPATEGENNVPTDKQQPETTVHPTPVEPAQPQDPKATDQPSAPVQTPEGKWWDGNSGSPAPTPKEWEPDEQEKSVTHEAQAKKMALELIFTWLGNWLDTFKDAKYWDLKKYIEKRDDKLVFFLDSYLNSLRMKWKMELANKIDEQVKNVGKEKFEKYIVKALSDIWINAQTYDKIPDDKKLTELSLNYIPPKADMSWDMNKFQWAFRKESPAWDGQWEQETWDWKWKQPEQKEESMEKPDPKVKESYLKYYRTSHKSMHFFQKVDGKTKRIDVIKHWKLVDEKEFDKMLVSVKHIYEEVWFKNFSLSDIYGLIYVESEWFDPLSTSPDNFSRWLMQMSNSAVIDMGHDRPERFQNPAIDKIRQKWKRNSLGNYVVNGDVSKTHSIYNYEDNLRLWMSYLKGVDVYSKIEEATLNLGSQREQMRSALRTHLRFNDSLFDKIFDEVLNKDSAYFQKYIKLVRYNQCTTIFDKGIERRFVYGFWVLMASASMFGGEGNFSKWKSKTKWSERSRTHGRLKPWKESWQTARPVDVPAPAPTQPAQPKASAETSSVPTQPSVAEQPKTPAPKPTEHASIPSVPSKPEAQPEHREHIDRKDIWAKTAIFGDSITEGYGRVLIEWYRDRKGTRTMEPVMKWHVGKVTIRGKEREDISWEHCKATVNISSKAILSNIRSYLEQHPKPNLKYAVIMAWANDYWNSDVLDNIANAKELLEKAWVKVVIWTYACTHPWVKGLNKKIRNTFGSSVLDIESKMKWWDLNNNLSWLVAGDGLHLNSSGYAKQVEIIEAYLKSLETWWQRGQTSVSEADQQMLDIAWAPK